jgi:hypothetical protein
VTLFQKTNVKSGLVNNKIEVGQKYNFLTVIKKDQNRKWLCKCDCEKITTVYGYDLLRNHTKSCGCYKRIANLETHLLHGYGVKNVKIKGTIYSSWRSMIRRITEEKHKSYKYYGGKEILIDPTWLNFQAFRRDLEESHFPNAHLHRIDPLLGYFKENVVWISRENHIQEHVKLRNKEFENKRFGYLTIIDPYMPNKFLCRCDCGNTKLLDKYKVKKGWIRSCGCLIMLEANKIQVSEN